MGERDINKKREELVNYVKANKIFSVLALVLVLIFIYGAYSLFSNGISFISISLLFTSMLSFLALSYRKYPLSMLPFAILIGVFIRIQNWALLQNKFPLALDPHVFLRYARYILEHGSIMAVDTLRYFPIGTETSKENVMLSYFFVYLYKGLQIFFPNITLEQTVLLYPVLMFALAIIPFYFLIKEIFGDKVAILSVFFLSIISSFLYRTMAGFSDKEALGVFFMFLAFYLYVKAIKNNSILFSLGSGISTGLMGLTWGGVQFAILIIAVFNIILFVLNKIENKSIFVYAAWVIPLVFILSIFTKKYGNLIGVMTTFEIGISVVVLFILFAGLFAKKIKLDIPNGVKTLLLLTFLGIILVPFIIGVSPIIDKSEAIVNQLLHPLGTSRLGLTVAENRQPYFTDWMSAFGIYFYLFAIGSVILFYNLVKQIKNRRLLTIIYSIFLCAFILTRYSEGSIFNGTNMISQLFFFGAITGFILFVIIGFVYSYYKDKKLHNQIKKLDNGVLFLFIWFLLTALAARGGMRLFFIFAPVTTILASYLIVKTVEAILDLKEKTYRIGAIILVLLIFIPIVYSFTMSSYQQAKVTGPSYNKQWQDAMDWTILNTHDDSVFAHWWDYGYWVQTGSNRATIVDGGNFISYWNHLMGRQVLCARNDTQALEYLKTHNATHLLIISDEIGKYTAYSSIGSDEDFDIFSWIGTYKLYPQATKKDENKTTYVFYGGTTLDDDLIWDEKIFPAKETIIGGFLIPIINEEDIYDFEIGEPTALLFYNGQEAQVPVNCVYDDHEMITFNNSGLGGCLRIMPYYINSRYQQENGALLYVSERGLKALWTRLFLFDEINPYFELVYDDSGMNQLASYGGSIVGPLKIWKINYPDNFTVSKELVEEYIAFSTPKWDNISQMSILEK